MRNGKSGKITLKDIAEIAGVTSMTVSRVVSGKGYVKESTRERILRIVKMLDYTPNLLARSLSSMRSRTIGIIIPKTEQIFLDNYLSQILAGVMAELKEKDYRLMIYPVDDEDIAQNGYLGIANSKLVDGIIMLKPRIDDPHLQNLAESGFPYILINHRPENGQYNFIDTDMRAANINVVRYLYEKGCRRIAFVAGSQLEQNGIDQLQGYRDGLQQTGLPFDERLLIYSGAGRANADIDLWTGGSSRPDAIICTNDYTAIAVIDKLKTRNISVPDEIAVIGFNDIELAKFSSPTLTTVKLPMLRIGKNAAEQLIALIEGEVAEPIKISLELQLIIRESA